MHDPADPVGRLLFNVLAMVAEFESDLIRLLTKEGAPVDLGVKVIAVPGLLTATRTGPSPAGECELMFRSGQPSTTSELWAHGSRLRPRSVA